jgi:hypothetical protein
MIDDPLGPPLSYRDLRNTPGIVAERLRDGRPAPLILDGVIRALIIPTTAAEADELARRLESIRFVNTLRVLQSQARVKGSGNLSIDEIDDEIAAVRAESARAELPAGADSPEVPQIGDVGAPRRSGSTPKAARPAAG